MRMNITMKRSIMIAAVVSVIGLGIALAGYLSGGMQSVSIGSSGITLTNNNNISVDETYPNIASIDMDIDLRDVILKEGSEFRVQSKGVGSGFKMHNTEGKLVVRDSDQNGFHFSLFEFNLDNSAYADLIVTYPAGKSFDNIKIASDSGEINIEKISAEHIDINSDLGDVKVTNSLIAEMKAKLDSGNLIFEDSGIESLEYNLNLGNLHSSGYTGRTITGEIDSGETKLAGIITGPINISSDLGNISLDLAGNEGQYSLKLKTDLGDIKINGSSSSNSLTRINGNKPLVDINCDSGNIDIDFNLTDM